MSALRRNFPVNKQMNYTLLLYICLPIIASLVMNVFIYTVFKKSSQQSSNEQSRKFLPPGYVIGIVWIVILGILGYVNYMLHMQKDFVSLALVVCIILACLAYPIYTRNFQELVKVGNSANLIFAFSCTVIIAMRSVNVIPYMIPLLLWNSYVLVTDVAR